MAPKDKLKIAIVTGGRSSERDISLVTAGRVMDNLDRSKYSAELVDTADPVALIRMAESRPDVAFVAQHGKGGEDGAIQGFLETLGIRYTGSGVFASALALDKQRTKELLQSHGITTPKSNTLNRARYSLADSGDRPLIVKPNASGSSDGLTVLREGTSERDYEAAVETAFRYDSTILIEQFVSGMEITGSVLGNTELEALPLIEIVPVKGVYDREAKYTPGATDEICPARLSAKLMAKAQAIACDCHRYLGCRGMSRTDMIVTPGEEIYMIEVNTIPGMTPTSLLPRAALQAGYSFPQMLDRLIALALEEPETK